MAPQYIKCTILTKLYQTMEDQLQTAENYTFKINIDWTDNLD